MRRPHLLYAIGVFCFAITGSIAQQIPAPLAPVPGGSTPVPGQTAPLPAVQGPTPDYSQQPFVVEHYKQTVRFENDGTGREEQEVSVRVISESGVQALGQLKVGYSALSDKLEIAYVRVHKSDGTVIAAQDSAVQDLTLPDAPVYTDYHQKHISVPSLRPGDTLEYRFVKEIVNPLIPGQFWTTYNFSERGIVLDEQVEINLPKNREVKLKTRPGFEPKTSDEGDRRIYRWTHSQTKDDQPRKRSADRDEPPAIQLTTFQSWEQLGDWYRSLETDRRQPTEAVKAKADALVAGKPDDMARVKALYDYVSRDFRYVSLSFGLGRFQPHAAAEVLSVGYGDCKDKNTLLAALLQAEGFESTSVLINAVRDLDPDVPSPSQFDHVITRVPVAGQEVWMDSTAGIVPFRMLPQSLRDKEALAVPPTGKPELVRTPNDLPFPAMDQSRTDGSLNDTGKLTAHFWTRVRGDQELALRFALRQIPSNRWKDMLQSSLVNTPFRGGEISNVKVSDPSDTDIPFQIDYDIAVNNYFDWSAAEPKLRVPVNGVFLAPAAPDDAEKGKPIKIGAAQQVETNAAIGIPGKYTVQLPIGVDLKRDYIEYHSSYKMQGDQLIINRALRVAVPEIPYDRREDWAAFRRVVESDQAQVVRLENKSPGTAGLGAATSANDLFEAGVLAYNNHDYELAVQLLQRVEASDPTHKGLTLALGRAYAAGGQDNKAVLAFQRQIAANPYDESAYNELGLVYQHQLKYDEAVAAFKKQIEVNPLDFNAHAALGILYLNLKRYGEAVPELEKAVSIQPKNPLVMAELGHAYLAAGETQPGMTAFDKAIAMSPTPLVWNNVAYALAEQQVQLARADAYSDAAITALDTQLRDVSLPNLRFQDLATTQALLNVWDTKGWVVFKQGDPDKAQAYVLPAWQSTQAGTVAEHLGDIAQLRNAREQAIRWYAMSLASDSPGNGARDKLTALGVGGSALDTMVEKSKTEILTDRTVKLDAIQKGTADFFLLVAPGKIEDVKFIKGEESLRAFTDALKSMSPAMSFPPGTQVHVVRRVRLSCGTAPAPKSESKGKSKTKGAAEPVKEPATASSLPGACTVEWIPSGEVRGIK
jgi:tetratricopeptide (TPR) repeat protein